MNDQPNETDFRPEGPQPLVRTIAPGFDYPVAALGRLREAVEAVQGITLAPQSRSLRNQRWQWPPWL